jgi:hypothetical protein
MSDHFRKFGVSATVALRCWIVAIGTCLEGIHTSRSLVFIVMNAVLVRAAAAGAASAADAAGAAGAGAADAAGAIGGILQTPAAVMTHLRQATASGMYSGYAENDALYVSESCKI